MPAVAKSLMNAHIVSQKVHTIDLESRRITRYNPASAALLAGPLPDPTRKRNTSVTRSSSPLSPPPPTPLPNLSPLSPAASPAVSVTSSSSPVALCSQEEMSTATGAARIDKDGKKVPKLQPGDSLPRYLARIGGLQSPNTVLTTRRLRQWQTKPMSPLRLLLVIMRSMPGYLTTKDDWVGRQCGFLCLRLLQVDAC